MIYEIKINSIAYAFLMMDKVLKALGQIPGTFLTNTIKGRSLKLVDTIDLLNEELEIERVYYSFIPGGILNPNIFMTEAEISESIIYLHHEGVMG